MISTQQREAAEQWVRYQSHLNRLFDDGEKDFERMGEIARAIARKPSGTVCIHFVDGREATEQEARDRWEDWCNETT